MSLGIIGFTSYNDENFYDIFYIVMKVLSCYKILIDLLYKYRVFFLCFLKCWGNLLRI